MGRKVTLKSSYNTVNVYTIHIFVWLQIFKANNMGWINVLGYIINIIEFFSLLQIIGKCEGCRVSE